MKTGMIATLQGPQAGVGIVPFDKNMRLSERNRSDRVWVGQGRVLP